MRAIVRPAAGRPLVAEDRPVPVAGEGGEVVRVTACGVCHTDVHVADGDIGPPGPLVLGHEVVATHPQLGQVLVYAPWGCRRPECRECAAGDEMICQNATEAGMYADGGYAQWLRVSSRDYLLPLGEVDPFSAAPLACAGLTAFRAVRRVLPLLTAARSRVAVIGVGGLGQYAVQFLRQLTSAEVVAVEPDPARRRTSLDLGADTAVSPEGLEGDFETVIDLVGSDSTLATGVRHLRRRGLLVAVGLFGGRVPFGVGAVPSEATLTTSIWGSLADLRDLLDHVRRNPVVTAVEVVGLSQAQVALDRVRQGRVEGRLVLDPAR